MPDTAIAEQVQTALPAETLTDVIIELAEARVALAPPSEIATLEAKVNELKTPRPEVAVEAVIEKPPAKPAQEAAPIEAAETVKQELESAEEAAAIAAQQLAADEAAKDEAAAVKVSERPRISHLSDDDKINANLINLYTRRGMSLAEASAIVLGTAGGQPERVEQPEVAQPASIEAIEAEMAALELQIDAGEGYADPQITKAYARTVLALAEARTDAKLNAAANAGSEQLRQKALVQVATDYPELRDKGSDLWRQAQEIALAIAHPSHPDHAKSGTPEEIDYCAARAAKILGKSKSATTQTAPVAKAPQPPQVTQTPAARQPGPASGSRGTAPAAPPPSLAERRAEAEARAEAAALGETYVPGRSYRIPVGSA